MLDLEEEVAAMFARMVVPWLGGNDRAEDYGFLTIDRSDGRGSSDRFTSRMKGRRYRERHGKELLRERKSQERARMTDAQWQRVLLREVSRRDRRKGKSMTAIEVYDALVPLVGNPAVFQYRNGEHVVGRWTTEADDMADVVHRALRGKPKIVLVLGRGASWAEAFEAARRTLFPAEAAKANGATVTSHAP